MNYMRFLPALALSFLSIGAGAQGAADFADPCVKLTKNEKSTAGALRVAADRTAEEWSKVEEPTADLYPDVLKAMKAALFMGWSERPDVKPLLEREKKRDAAFDAEKYFGDEVYAAVVPAPEEKEMVNAFYKALVMASLVNGRAELEQTLQKRKDELNQSCKKDVFNQILRVTIGNAAQILGSNLEAGKKESGELSKITRSTIGVSLDDIQKHGLTGGPNSELNKALNNLAGKNTPLRQALQSVINLPVKLAAPKFKVGGTTIDLNPIPKKWPKLPKCCKL